MGTGNTTSQDLINLALRGVTLPWNANTNNYMALHTADPGAGGSQTTNETSYTNYARQALSRATGTWTATNPSTNVAAITFPASASANVTITHVSIGTVISGAGQILWSGALNTPFVVVNGGSAPVLSIGQVSVTMS